jgi:hypothetical protein
MQGRKGEAKKSHIVVGAGAGADIRRQGRTSLTNSLGNYLGRQVGT